MDLVTVGSYPTTAEAELAKNLLEAEGLKAYVEEGETGGLFSITAPFGETKVAVSSADAEQAREILREAVQHRFTKEAAAEAEEHSHDKPEDEE